jgi:hypothetical protein
MIEGNMTVIVLLLSTLVVLILGVVFMATNTTLNKKYGNKLMILRVALQAFTIIVASILYIGIRKS